MNGLNRTMMGMLLATAMAGPALAAPDTPGHGPHGEQDRSRRSDRPTDRPSVERAHHDNRAQAPGSQHQQRFDARPVRERDERPARADDSRNDRRDDRNRHHDGTDRADERREHIDHRAGHGSGRDWSYRQGTSDWAWRGNGRDDDRRHHDWRADRRYNWQHYRSQHQSHYRLPRYYAPAHDHDYRRWAPGYRLDHAYYGRNYWISDPWAYRLPPAYGDSRWVRYHHDVVLVDIRNGLIVDIIYSFFL